MFTQSSTSVCEITPLHTSHIPTDLGPTHPSSHGSLTCEYETPAGASLTAHRVEQGAAVEYESVTGSLPLTRAQSYPILSFTTSLSESNPYFMSNSIESFKATVDTHLIFTDLLCSESLHSASSFQSRGAVSDPDLHLSRLPISISSPLVDRSASDQSPLADSSAPCPNLCKTTSSAASTSYYPPSTYLNMLNRDTIAISITLPTSASHDISPSRSPPPHHCVSPIHPNQPNLDAYYSRDIFEDSLCLAYPSHRGTCNSDSKNIVSTSSFTPSSSLMLSTKAHASTDPCPFLNGSSSYSGLAMHKQNETDKLSETIESLDDSVIIVGVEPAKTNSHGLSEVFDIQLGNLHNKKRSKDFSGRDSSNLVEAHISEAFPLQKTSFTAKVGPERINKHIVSVVQEAKLATKNHQLALRNCRKTHCFVFSCTT
ncbi:unnamed protein product [Protopolystoma xenopodis]|uniref:Uncharacterized protein n=1 Tax=Protopolystoma xenopodis TaxID=117903 RepID=A0A3S5FCT5_9PLAT|nr:unnamed protein product [Protopolystoma xenopodis]